MKKSDVLEMLESMPDDLDVEELMYRLYVIREIEASEAEFKAGKGIPHEEIVRITDGWFTEDAHPGRTNADNTAKGDVRRILDEIPDGSTLEEIQYQIYVMSKIQRGLKAADEGRFVSDEEVKRRLSRWLGE